MIDQFSRRINYLRLSITDLCNLKCKYCMPADGVDKKSHFEILRIEEYIKIVREAAKLGIDKVRITGGEPLVRKGIISLIEEISEIKEIKDLAMTTNGVLLKGKAKALKEAGLKRVNISLDTLNPIKYSEITRGGSLIDVLDGIDEALRARLVPIKINVVLMNGFNTKEVLDFINLASDDIEVRFIELMPIGEASNWNNSNFISNENIYMKYSDLLVDDIDDLESFGGPARYYRRKGSNAKIGFINPISNHFCDRCNRIRVTSDGKLKTCLHSNEEIDLSSALKVGEQKLKDLLVDSILKKPERHFINDIGFGPIIRDMNRIGG